MACGVTLRRLDGVTGHQVDGRSRGPKYQLAETEGFHLGCKVTSRRGKVDGGPLEVSWAFQQNTEEGGGPPDDPNVMTPSSTQELKKVPIIISSPMSSTILVGKILKVLFQGCAHDNEGPSV